MQYETATDEEVIDVFFELSRMEGNRHAPPPCLFPFPSALPCHEPRQATSRIPGPPPIQALSQPSRVLTRWPTPARSPRHWIRIPRSSSTCRAAATRTWTMCVTDTGTSMGLERKASLPEHQAASRIPEPIASIQKAAGVIVILYCPRDRNRLGAGDDCGRASNAGLGIQSNFAFCFLALQPKRKTQMLPQREMVCRLLQGFLGHPGDTSHRTLYFITVLGMPSSPNRTPQVAGSNGDVRRAKAHGNVRKAASTTRAFLAVGNTVCNSKESPIP